MKIVQDYDLGDRTEPYRPGVPRVTLKDHKEGFLSRPSVRLINPSKTDLGVMSKKILDRVTPGLRDYIRLVQWRNTDAVVDWFKY